jgi:tetratricopeptide (TPR) repeat protein
MPGHPPSEAIEKLNRSLQIARETDDVGDEARALHNRGSVYDQLGDPEQALEDYRQALGLWRQLRSESSAAEVLSLMAKVERKQGKLELAMGHIDEAIRLTESRPQQVGEPGAAGLLSGHDRRPLRNQDRTSDAI